MTTRGSIRTRTALICSLLFVIAGTIGASLLVVRNRMQAQVGQELASNLTQAVKASRNLQVERVAALRRENALLADLPSLKALMTTSDQRTITDGAVEFWKVSDNDLFALAGKDQNVLTAYTRGRAADGQLMTDLSAALQRPGEHLLLSEGRLFEFAVHPLYFGDEKTGTLLGYVVSGYAMDQAFVREVSDAAAVFTSILSGQDVLASTLQPDLCRQLRAVPLVESARPLQIVLNREHYLGAVSTLSETAKEPLRVLVLKSSDEAERTVRQINQLVFLVGLCAVIAGSLLMLAAAQIVTRPLEALAAGVRAFGAGDNEHSLPERGPLEIRELSAAFARMRTERAATQRALLESERLATIGRMASSVSHDLRHYLAAVYANAEFLASAGLPEGEREELFQEIKAAVHGTTDLIDSLLVFSRTGSAVQRSEVPVVPIVERAVALIRSHPDASGVELTLHSVEKQASTANVDGRQLERALYNLMLNACQAERESQVPSRVSVRVEATAEEISVTIVDNGKGVPDAIRESLFEPFVSEGKQKGTGLGLTLAHSIAREHGGGVELLTSTPAHTAFRLSLCRGLTTAAISATPQEASE